MSNEHHIVPVKIYLLIFSCLLICTALTVAASFIDMGALNTPVALLIAVFKASLVVLFFMHVRYGNKLIWLFAGGGFLWLLILLAFTLSDYLSRGWLGKPPIEFLEQASTPF